MGFKGPSLEGGVHDANWWSDSDESTCHILQL